MSARGLTYIAISTALLAVSAWIAFPLGEGYVTMQTAIICLIAALLGAKRSVFAVVAYILLGAIGAPVFAGFTGGIAKLLAPTGGYIVGFIPLACVVGVAADVTKNLTRGRWLFLIFSIVLGTFLCYALGTAWFALTEGASLGIWAAVTICVLPYLPFDIAKIFLTVYLVKKLRKFIKTE